MRRCFVNTLGLVKENNLKFVSEEMYRSRNKDEKRE